MTQHLTVVGGHPKGFGATCRTDNWWAGAAATLAGLLAFIVYVTWASFQGEHFTSGPYLSPFYSPVLFTPPGGEGASHAWLGQWPGWWPAFLPASPALLILVVPASFRFTCYYYRKAYYRSFAGSPPGCAAGPLASRPYQGETRLLLFQNLHRYALYLAALYIPILYYDAFVAFSWEGQFGIGVGTIVLLVNATLIAGYTFGCHSFRHLIGGRSDCMSCGQATAQYGAWRFASWFNARHMQFAWFSLVWVMLTDLYVRLCSMGIITDLNTW
jgi:hypothetical protein